MRGRLKQKAEKNTKKLARAIDYPADAFFSVPSVHVTGLDDVLVEGCKGILVCEPDKLVFDMGAYTTGIVGRSLVIRELSKTGDLSVEGKISAVTFDGKGAQ